MLEVFGGTFSIKPILSFKNEIETEKGERGAGCESGVEKSRGNIIYEDLLTSSGIQITHRYESQADVGSLRSCNLRKEISSLN